MYGKQTALPDLWEGCFIFPFDFLLPIKRQGNETATADEEEGENDQDTEGNHLPSGSLFPQDFRVLRFVQ